MRAQLAKGIEAISQAAYGALNTQVSDKARFPAPPVPTANGRGSQHKTGDGPLKTTRTARRKGRR